VSDSQAQRANRRLWDADSEDYQSRHAAQLAAAGAGWGVWSVPESRLGALGEVAGRRVLEAGCGAAHFSAALAGLGAHCVGLDLSGSQLAAARRTVAGRVRLVQADAERMPFADASFDLVFCDHGSTTWADPRRVVPEAARVLRPGGRFVANLASPWLHACVDPATDEVRDRMREDYFDRGPIDQGGGAVVHSLTYGEWVRLLRDCGLVVEDLIEIRPDPGASTTYQGYVGADWARRWPAEMLWVASRPGR
jgi:SAM-dependent methyltransferase